MKEERKLQSCGTSFSSSPVKRFCKLDQDRFLWDFNMLKKKKPITLTFKLIPAFIETQAYAIMLEVRK